MQTRREFLQRAVALGGASLMPGMIPASIARALAIDPDHGTTFLDAEHIVILMQENRSFDHAYGALRGVRGFSDPRVFKLANGNPVWLQTNDNGETYCPFRMDMRGSRATWMGSLPHSWENQSDSRNHGYYDKWLQNKANSIPEYAAMPLTLGYYTREDIPYYYALADAFTICDQNFCSSLTGTTPNRLYLWTGTVRGTRDGTSMPIVRNEEIDYPLEANYTTFPERLEKAGISWKVYQNEINLDTGLTEDENVWLTNFSDNPLEWFTEYRIRHYKGYQAHLARLVEELPKQIEALKLQRGAMADSGDRMDAAKKIADMQAQLKQATEDRAKWTAEAFQALSDHEKNLHQKAFVVNEGDPDYRSLTTIEYDADGKKRQVLVPKGDVLHQFRKDVDTGQLPTVSWLVPPETFSDHPSSAWYGAWYIAECMDILTKNPDVWKKTVFILCYDENDGYFDHVPPFTAPHPYKPGTGKVSTGIDTSPDYLEMALELKRLPPETCREGPIGLGFRVPLVICSPWSRGGMVNSQVFDHTSILRFLEVFLSHKTGKPIKEENIGDWRRTVCGDLTSTFQPYHGEALSVPTFPPRNEFIEGIHRALYKDVVGGFHPLSETEIETAKSKGLTGLTGRLQEPGTRPSLPLAYELHADGVVTQDKQRFEITLRAGNSVFGKKSLGGPFNVCAYHSPGKLSTCSYAVAPGDKLVDSWPLADFEGGRYHLRIDGPNGFFREFMGTRDTRLQMHLSYTSDHRGDLELWIFSWQPGAKIDSLNEFHSGPGTEAPAPIGSGENVTVTDLNTGEQIASLVVRGQQGQHVIVPSSKTSGWYNFSVTTQGGFEHRFAGRVETGKVSISDPAMA